MNLEFRKEKCGLETYLEVVSLNWKSLSCVRLFATPWSIARQAPLSREFSRQEYWSGLPFSSLRRSSWPRDRTECLASPALAGEFLCKCRFMFSQDWVLCPQQRCTDFQDCQYLPVMAEQSRCHDSCTHLPDGSELPVQQAIFPSGWQADRWKVSH